MSSPAPVAGRLAPPHRTVSRTTYMRRRCRRSAVPLLVLLDVSPGGPLTAAWSGLLGPSACTRQGPGHLSADGVRSHSRTVPSSPWPPVGAERHTIDLAGVAGADSLQGRRVHVDAWAPALQAAGAAARTVARRLAAGSAAVLIQRFHQ